MSAEAEHERIAGLLPWFVNGTLDDTERSLVERHVRECLPCRKGLEEERRLNRAVREQAVAPDSMNANLDRLMRRIDQEEPRAKGRSRIRRRARYSGLLTWLQLGAAAAVVALLIVGIRSLQQVPVIGDGSAPYSTASDAATTSDAATAGGGPADGAAAGTAARIDLVFADSVTEAELRSVLLEIGGSVVAGPTAIGRYTIELDEPGLDDAALDRIIDELERDPRIRLAARSYIAP